MKNKDYYKEADIHELIDYVNWNGDSIILATKRRNHSVVDILCYDQIEYKHTKTKYHRSQTELERNYWE